MRYYPRNDEFFVFVVWLPGAAAVTKSAMHTQRRYVKVQGSRFKVQISGALMCSVLQRAQRGSCSHLKGLRFEETNIVELKIGLNCKGISLSHSSVRSTVDALNEGRKYCLLIYNSH